MRVIRVLRYLRLKVLLFPLLTPERGTRIENPVTTALSWRGPHWKESC